MRMTTARTFTMWTRETLTGMVLEITAITALWSTILIR